MITMNNWASQAVDKLEKEYLQIPKIADNEIGKKLQSKEAAETKAALMAEAIKEVLKDLCLQCEDFAKAVLAGNDLFSCMKKVAEGEGNYIDGVTACRKAVQFYLPGAEIQQKTTVQIPGTDGSHDGRTITLNLEDLM